MKTTILTKYKQALPVDKDLSAIRHTRVGDARSCRTKTALESASLPRHEDLQELTRQNCTGEPHPFDALPLFGEARPLPNLLSTRRCSAKLRAIHSSLCLPQVIVHSNKSPGEPPVQNHRPARGRARASPSRGGGRHGRPRGSDSGCASAPYRATGPDEARKAGEHSLS